MASLLRFVATCVPGAEKWVARELAALNVANTYTSGAVQGRASLTDIRRVVADARLVESVRVRPVQSFRSASFQALRDHLGRAPWHAYLVAGLPLDIRVTCSKSRLYHSDAVAERVLQVIRERTRREWRVPAQRSVNDYCNRLYIRIDNDDVEVGVDASGEALHRRGYRTHVTEAPLRETLAALLVELSKDAAPDSTLERLWDPCCGSGTIPLEWLESLFHVGTMRRFIMDEWPCFSRSVPPTASSAAPVTEVKAFGCDISDRAVAAALANAKNLGVEGACSFGCSDFGAFAERVPARTAVVTNLPYGVRLENQREAAKVFQRLDDVLKTRRDLRPAVVLWGGGKRIPPLKNQWGVALRFKNGGLPVTAFVLR
jgi:putative N6-adenine-specific DNA methylase